MLDVNISNICNELYLFCCNNDQIKFENFIIKFYIDYISDTNNSYIAIFLKNKLEQLSIKSDRIHRKILCEIVIFLSICNKPNKQNISNIEIECNIENLLKMMKSHNKGGIKYILDKLIKSKEEFEFEFDLDITEKQKKDYVWKLWEIILNYSDNSYTESLFFLYCLNYNNKLRKERLKLLYDAYYSICNHMIISSYDYNKIIIQCMLKIDMLFQNNSKEEMYELCINMCPEEEISGGMKEYKYMEEKKKIEIEEYKKIYFYKSNEQK